jgi:hypothetical protein
MNYDEFYKGNEYKGASEHVRFKLEFAPNKEVVFLNENKQVKEQKETQQQVSQKPNEQKQLQPTETKPQQNQLKKQTKHKKKVQQILTL